MKYLSFFLILVILFSCQESKNNVINEDPENKDLETLEVLLVGSFHFNNFNPENNGDIVELQIPDVLLDEHQSELKLIANKIAKFNPDKIFIEELFSQQKRLDSVYSAFPKSTDYKTSKRQETYQLGFRVAKKLKHSKIFGIDLRTNFPYDSLVNQMTKAKQFDLIKKDDREIEALEKSFNQLLNSKATLSEMLFYFNDDTYRKTDINWYLSLANQGGELDNFVGSYLVSEWYKRNLYMYSIIQKSIEKKDKKIMILAGASHIAMFKDFIDYNPEWKTVELKEIMKE